MLFGNRDTFAFEMIDDVESPPFGIDACMWAKNKRIGNPRPWFGTYVNYLEGYLEALRERRFANLPAELRALSDHDLICAFNVALASDWMVRSTSIERFMLYDLDDSLDGWRVFVTEIDDQCRIWWTDINDPTPTDFENVFIHRDSLLDSISAFVLAGRKVISDQSASGQP